MELKEIQKALEIKKLEDRFEMVNPVVVIDPSKVRCCNCVNIPTVVHL